MSEATSAPSAAPSSAPAQPGAAASESAGPSEIGRKSVKPEAPPSDSSGRQEAPGPQWSDADEKAFFELAKRSPYKARIKGEERAIDSKDALRELLNHAQRGIGASKVVEQAKKEAAEAAKAREEAAKERQTFERARAGDFEARKALGLVPPEELAAHEAEWQQVPKEVRQLLEERNRFAQELEKHRAEAAERQRTEKAQAEERQLLAAKRTAINAANEVSKALGLTQESAERMLPHVAGAIADLSEEGLELGVDMTTELIVDRVKARIGDFSESHFEALEPTRALAIVEKRLAAMDDATLTATLSKDTRLRIAKLVAREMRASKAQPTRTQVEESKREEPKPKPPMVLSPMRWR